MKINIFNNASPFHPFRWFILFAIALSGLMLYADLTGMRLFAFTGNQQQWSSKGPGFHK